MRMSRTRASRHLADLPADERRSGDGGRSAREVAANSRRWLTLLLRTASGASTGERPPGHGTGSGSDPSRSAPPGGRHAASVPHSQPVLGLWKDGKEYDSGDLASEAVDGQRLTDALIGRTARSGDPREGQGREEEAQSRAGAGPGSAKPPPLGEGGGHRPIGSRSDANPSRIRDRSRESREPPASRCAAVRSRGEACRWHGMCSQYRHERNILVVGRRRTRCVDPGAQGRLAPGSAQGARQKPRRRTGSRRGSRLRRRPRRSRRSKASRRRTVRAWKRRATS